MREERTAAVVADDLPSRRLTTTRGTVETGLILAVFAVYAAFLVKLLLLSRAPGSERSLNLVPFATIASYLFGTARAAFANVVGNVLVFIPLGVYTSWLRRRGRAWVTVLMVGAVSVAVEIIQGVFAVGASDIDDVILNTAGGLLGVLGFRLLSATLRERSHARSALAVLSLLTVPVWGYFLVVIRLHL